MPLLTHEETGAESVARHGAVALAERPAAPSVEPRRSRYSPVGRKTVSAELLATRWKRIRKWVYIGLAALLMAPVLAFVIGWIIFPVPSSEEAALAQVARFTFADGDTELATLRPEGSGNERINRELITLDQVPVQVQRAVLSAEDRSFFSNPGFDFIGIARAAFNQLTGGVGGGSTITQQYVKVSTGQDDYSLWRKYQEVVVAVKISREQTKEQILENYLNTIYLGRGAYGVQAASEAYFGRPVQDLTVSEGAMLAGIIQSPSRWDPAQNAERSQERWNFVLDGMVEQGWLDASERNQQVFPTTWLPAAPATTGVPGDDRYHIYERAMAELEANGISEEQINTAGLTITTTIQQPQQAQAVEAINEVMENQPQNLREALVSIDPRTGAIVSYYGGSEGLGLDYAGEALRQPGSSFKPFVLTAALQAGDGVGLGSVYDGRSGQVFVPGQAPVDNSEGFDCGRCDVKFAMTRSINTVFYKMALDTGLQNVINAAHQLGIPNDLINEARGGLALGDQEVHPIDMASAFATFAADGVYHQPYIVSRVESADGQVLYEHEPSPGEQRIPQQVARNVTESMLDVARTANIALDGRRPAAAKTGTVQQGDTGNDNKDAWTVGYTPSLATAVWIGTDTSEPIRDSRNRPIYGRMLPGQIWQGYMNSALEGTDDEEFSRFVPIGTAPSGFGGGQQSAPSTSAPQTNAPDDDADDDDNRGNNNDNNDNNADNNNGNGNRNNNGNGNRNGQDGADAGSQGGGGLLNGNDDDDVGGDADDDEQAVDTQTADAAGADETSGQSPSSAAPTE